MAVARRTGCGLLWYSFGGRRQQQQAQQPV